MDEVGEVIVAAWERVKARIADRPNELRKRLARRTLASIDRTPRARCLAVRANDLRIAGTTVDPGAGYWRHEVWLDAREVARLCTPVEITPPGEPVHEVAARLGLTRMGLLQARLRGVFETTHVAGLSGRNGRPVPVIYTPRALDPNAQLFALADPIWGWLGRELHRRVPADLEQRLTRVPCYWAAGARYAADLFDPDDGAGAGAGRRNSSRRLPPPGPDLLAAYKWKGEEYLGYDWRNPAAKAGYERHQRALARVRAARRERVRRNPPASRAGGSMLFRGWWWLCPACERPAKVLFYPMPPVSVLHCALTHYADGLPRWFVAEALAALEAEQARSRRFACSACNRVARFSRVSDNMWNEVVAYLSGGLLYGNEVARPACVTADRKLAFVTHRRQPSPAHEHRRARVCERLVKGWSYKRIAAEMGISFSAVHGDAKELFRRHGVHGREALARAVGVALTLPPSKWSLVCAGVAAGKSNGQIARETGIAKHIVARYAWKYRRSAAVSTVVG